MAKRAKSHRIQTELERVRKSHRGILRPIDVVRAAEPEDSPLHPCFQWDDTAAAQQYRLWQARQLIRVSVTVIGGDDFKVRRYVSFMQDRTSNTGGYRALVDILSDEEATAVMLSEALDELNVFRRKYSRLSMLRPIFEAAEKVAKRCGSRKK